MFIFVCVLLNLSRMIIYYGYLISLLSKVFKNFLIKRILCWVGRGFGWWGEGVGGSVGVRWGEGVLWEIFGKERIVWIGLWLEMISLIVELKWRIVVVFVMLEGIGFKDVLGEKRCGGLVWEVKRIWLV